MARYKAECSFQGKSGLPRDKYTNTFHFTGPTPQNDIQFGHVTDKLADFYLVPDDLDKNVLSWMSEEVGNPLKIDIYDMADAEPRTPVYSETYATTGGTNGNGRLPPELAVCLSFRGDFESGVNPQTRKGRVFIGPLRTTACDPATGRPSAGFIHTLRFVGIKLVGDIEAQDWQWVVWSEAAQHAEPVNQGWVDDEFDVHRSRELTATARNIWTT